MPGVLPNALSVLSDRHNIPGLYFGHVFVFNLYDIPEFHGVY